MPVTTTTLLLVGGGIAAGAAIAKAQQKSPKLPAAPKPKEITPPATPGPEAASAAADVRERQARIRGRRASRITATPGALAISDVNILRPELKDTLA